VPLGTAELRDVMARIVDGAAPATLETDQLDFERQPDSRGDAIKVLVDAAVCFANSEGGTVVDGRNERNGWSRSGRRLQP